MILLFIMKNGAHSGTVFNHGYSSFEMKYDVMPETARITAGIRIVYAGISCGCGRSLMMSFI